MIGKILDLPKIVDPRGNLTVAEQLKNVPFDIARVYWTYDIPAGERRGGHAHRICEEIIIAVSGSFDVELFVWFWPLSCLTKRSIYMNTMSSCKS